MRRLNRKFLEFKNVNGREYIYFRRGKVRHRLKSDPDSEEFDREYWDICSGKKAKTVTHSWNALIIAFYRSPAFTSKAAGTRENYRRHCEAIREMNGDKDVRTSSATTPSQRGTPSPTHGQRPTSGSRFCRSSSSWRSIWVGSSGTR